MIGELQTADEIALMSGGHDSLVMTHHCMEEGMTEGVLHLDTGTGIPANEEFVRDVCEEYGWPLEVRSAKKTLEEFATDLGFPKAGSHSWAYRYFKEHTLGRFTTDLESAHPRYYTGVRKGESDRRMRNITAEEQEAGNGRWTWVAPIASWTKHDCNTYIEEYELPRNPVVENIHRSGECFCGAFAHRDEELIDLEAHYPEHYEWLMELEKNVQEERGIAEDSCWWGGGGLSSRELRELTEEFDRSDMKLCQDCESPFPSASGEADDW